MQTKRLPLLLALPLLALSCGKEPAQPADAGNLLLRQPDSVVEQVGILTPDPRMQWGEHGPFDWEDRTETREVNGEEAPFVWSRDPIAKLLLPAGAPRDRMLKLTAWSAAETAEGRSADVSLNGIALEKIELGQEPANFEIEVPAPTWKESPNNLLEITLPELHQLDTNRNVGVALARVEYDTPSNVDVDAAQGQLALGPCSAVTYHLEPLCSTQFVLEGSSTGPGTLIMGASRVDPATGDVVGEESSFSLNLNGENLERAFPEPLSDDGILRLRLSWNSDSGARFEVATLRRIESTAVERPPVIFISIDTLAAKHLPFHGYERDTAPELTEFTRDAVTFDHCVTNAPWTVPSFMSQMTGLYAYANRLESRTKEQAKAELWEKWYLSQNRWTMAEFMRAAGYATGGFADNLWITERFGFPQGFDAFDTSAGTIAKPDPEGGIRHVVGLAKEWLEGRVGEAPFFLFLHAFDVHGPYTPSAPYAQLFEDQELYSEERMAPVRGRSDSLGVIHDYLMYGEAYQGIQAPSRIQTHPFADAYDQGIAMTDADVGKFFDYLREQGLYDKSLIIVTSDHGETMDEAEMLFAHGVMDEAVLHIPLIVKLPGGKHAGKRVDTTVQLVDLFPTVLDLVGMDERPYLHGRSLLPVIEGDDTSSVPTYTEGGSMSQRSVTMNGWKLVEKIPGQDSSRAYLLSLPDLADTWKNEILPWIPTDNPSKRTFNTILREGAEIEPIFQRIAEEGLHRTLYDELSPLPEVRGVHFILRRFFAEPRYELYDLSNDPKALRNLASEHPTRVAEIQQHMRSLESAMEASRKQARPPSAPPKLSAEDIARLEDLGYADPSSQEDG